MNDGNTALPVSPVTEDDTMKLAAIFSKAAEAVVNASTLPRQIEALQAQFATLRADYEAKVLHAQELDAQLSDMRGQRDRAEQELSQTRSELSIASAQVTELERQVDERRQAIEALNEEVRTLRRERDDHGYRAMQLEEERDAAHRTLSDIQAKVSSLFPTSPPAPVAVPKWDDPSPPTAPADPSPSYEPGRY